jgi:phosphoribosylglycinamide formyltransferase-1
VTPTAILISGSGSNMIVLVRSMTREHPARPALVVSDVAGAAGLERAAELNVPAAMIERARYPDRAGFEAALDAALAGVGAEIVCLAGFMRLLSPWFVDRWRGRMLNIHPSLLPRHRGLDTHGQALAAGVAETGCTVHEVTAAVDDGPILGQARVPILPGDTPQTLAARLLGAEHVLYPAVLRRFASGDRTPLLLP